MAGLPEADDWLSAAECEVLAGLRGPGGAVTGGWAVGSPSAASAGRDRARCDLELVEPWAQIFACDYLTVGELAFVEGCAASGRVLFVNLTWSVKESALKARRQGLTLDTPDVGVVLDVDVGFDLGWRPVGVGHRGRTLKSWWRVQGRHVLTAVAEPPASRLSYFSETVTRGPPDPQTDGLSPLSPSPDVPDSIARR